MKLLLTGGSDYVFTDADAALLSALDAAYTFTVLATSPATALATTPKWWAEAQGIPLEDFPVSGASPAHVLACLEAMADYVGRAGMCVAFPGGDTRNALVHHAQRVGMLILRVTPRRAEATPCPVPVLH